MTPSVFKPQHVRGKNQFFNVGMVEKFAPNFDIVFPLWSRTIQ
jgi:hypothetical protein